MSRIDTLNNPTPEGLVPLTSEKAFRDSIDGLLLIYPTPFTLISARSDKYTNARAFAQKDGNPFDSESVGRKLETLKYVLDQGIIILDTSGNTNSGYFSFENPLQTKPLSRILLPHNLADLDIYQIGRIVYSKAHTVEGIAESINGIEKLSDPNFDVDYYGPRITDAVLTGIRELKQNPRVSVQNFDMFNRSIMQ